MTHLYKGGIYRGAKENDRILNPFLHDLGIYILLLDRNCSSKIIQNHIFDIVLYELVGGFSKDIRAFQRWLSDQPFLYEISFFIRCCIIISFWVETVSPIARFRSINVYIGVSTALMQDK
jgi:hypothetical protein